MAPTLTRVRVAHIATVDMTVRALLLPQLRALRDAGFDVSAISAAGPSVGVIADAGIRHIEWRNATRAWDPLADARAFGELVGILRRERFDIVHTHNAKPGVMGRIAARLTGVPCVVNTVHGFDARPDDPLGRRLAFMGLEWLAARFSDLELYQGEFDLARARRLRMVNARKALFLGNGTDITKFDPACVAPQRIQGLRRELGIGPDEVVVGTIGRLVGEKGYRELIQVARRVRSERRDVRFLAIGVSDPAKADALTPAEIRTAGDDVIFAGWRDDVPDVLAVMDVFVLPSWREGVPRSAIEAAAMGKPLILSDIPGCRQVARHGVEGLLVPPRDPVGLGDAVLRLVADGPLRARMGAAARARALDRFDERRVVETVVRGYGDLLRRDGTGSR